LFDILITIEKSIKCTSATLAGENLLVDPTNGIFVVALFATVSMRPRVQISNWYIL